MLSTQAAAQDAAAETGLSVAVETPAAGDEIVVTGTNIGRPDLQVSSPVSVLGQEEINQRQPNSAEELLRDLPSVRPSLGAGTNLGSDGSATVNLRGIGDNRTLVILDGRRIVPFGLEGVVDLNVIPIGLVERVDVVTGGASSVYGADAVAGVVNFITRKNFHGLDLQANYRLSERGDASQYRADLLVGRNFGDGRGNVVLGVGYSNRNPLFVTDREIAQIPISSANGLFQGSTAASPPIFQSGLQSPTNPNGLPTAGLGSVLDPVTGLFRAATQADTFNGNIGTYFMTPLERVNVYAAGRYEVTPDVELYSSAMFVKNAAALSVSPTGTFNNSFALPLNNPFIPAAARSQLCAANGIDPASCAAAAAAVGGAGTPGYRQITVIPSRRFTELGPRENSIDSKMYQVQAGVRGNVSDGIRYDVSAQFGETRQNNVRTNWGSYSKTQQALLAYRDGAGNNVCVDASNGCVPLNLFGPVGSVTQDQLDFINLDAQLRRVVKQSVATATISGDLFGITSPFATSEVAFSLGAEYRKLSARTNPDLATQTANEVLGALARTPPDAGSYSVREIFGELIVPLIEDRFIHKMSLEGGYRYSDYSTTGSSSTWKAGSTIEPIEGLKFRGMYQQAVRSPNILELFQSPVQGLANLAFDPCGGPNPTAPMNLCVATGAPAATYGGIPQPSASINFTTSGNRNLDVERASTYTLGVVVMPRLISRLSVTVDYFNIKIKDLISIPAQNDILNGCYSAALNPTQTPNAFCALIARNPLTGSLVGGADTPGVILASSNLGRLATAGVDFGLNYRLPLEDLIGSDAGNIRFSFNGTWLDYYHFQATPNSINRDCTGFYSQSCTNPRPKWKWNSRLGYEIGPVEMSLLWTHLSAVELETARPAGIALGEAAPGNTAAAYAGILPAFREIPAYNYFDIGIKFDVNETFQVNFLVENMFDKKPPLVGTGVGGAPFNNGNTFPTTYDVVGRSFTASARLRF